MKTIEDIISNLKQGLVVDESMKSVSAGLESFDPAMREVVAGKVQSLQADVESVLKELTISPATEAIDIKPYQIEAAKQAAIYAVDPKATLSKFANGRESVNAGMEATVIDTSKFVPDVIHEGDIKAAMEAFDGQVLNSSLYFTVAYNALAIKQDAVAELFYPIIVVDANKAAVKVSAKITNIMQTVKRDISGNPTNYKLDSLIKRLNDTALFTQDANRLYPVVRPEAADNLLTPNGVQGLVKTVTVMDGVEIETAPVIAGKKVDYLGLSQPDELIAKGVMDETDALNGHVAVERLYFKITGKDANGNSVTEYHVKEIKGLPATFTYTVTGSSKELQLNYSTDSIVWTGGNILKADATPTAIQSLLDLPAGYNVKVHLNLKGDGEAQKGTLAVYSVALELLAVTDAAGNAIPETDQLFIDMKDVFNTLEFAGYDVEAFAANSNARFRGKIITNNTYTYLYTIPTRTKVRELVSVVNTGEDGDTAGILAQIDFTKQSLTKHGLLALNTTALVLENIADDTEEYGISSKLVNKFSFRDAIDLSTLVDSIKSTDRVSDIKAALRLTIRNIAVEMYNRSNYGKAFGAIYPGVKPTVIIGTDVNIGRFLEGFEDDVFKYVVETTTDNLVAGKVFISFGIMGTERNKTPNMLNFGACFWSPEVVVSLQRSDNGTVRNETIVMPRFVHQTFMPILSVLEVTGVEAVSGKLPINFNQI